MNEDLKKSDIENSDVGHFLEIDVKYPEKLHKHQNDLPFLSEIMKIGKFENLCVA